MTHWDIIWICMHCDTALQSGYSILLQASIALMTLDRNICLYTRFYKSDGTRTDISVYDDMNRFERDDKPNTNVIQKWALWYLSCYNQALSWWPEMCWKGWQTQYKWNSEMSLMIPILLQPGTVLMTWNVLKGMTNPIQMEFSYLKEISLLMSFLFFFNVFDVENNKKCIIQFTQHLLKH